jgi:DNA polymerase-3 subunit beta
MNQVTFSRAQLLEALMVASAFVESKPTHPIMGGVLFSFDMDSLTLVAMSDKMGVQIEYQEPISCGAKKSFVVPHKLLIDSLNKMRTDEVMFSFDELESHRLVCRSSKKSQIDLDVMDGMDYPSLPSVDSDPIETKLDTAEFKRSLQYLIPFASSDESRLILNGVCLGTTNWYSTDGHRMSEFQGKSLDSDIILPLGFLRQLIRYSFDEFPLYLKFNEYGSIVTIENGPYHFFSRILEGQYPNCAQLIPKSYGFTATLDRKDFLNELELVMTVASQRNDVVAIYPTTDSFVITAEASGVGRIEGQVDATIYGDIDRIGFNGKYLIEVLGISKAKTVKLQGNGKTNPFVLTFDGEDEFLHLIMPVQIRD